jgi:hypothetical protein
MAGQFESETEWKDFALDIYTDEYPSLKNLTYEKAKKIYEKNSSQGMYRK